MLNVELYLINMKKLLLIIGIIFAISACAPSPVERIVYVNVTDTITITDTIINKEQIILLEHKYCFLQDSLNSVKDSIAKDLFIAKYKLARIKYYNEVAAKGNNIKYLRGWINRVLNN